MVSKPKLWYWSKTLWINVIGIAAIIIQSYYQSFVLTPELQAGALAIINLILRQVTKEPIVWTEK